MNFPRSRGSATSDTQPAPIEITADPPVAWEGSALFRGGEVAHLGVRATKYAGAAMSVVREEHVIGGCVAPAWLSSLSYYALLNLSSE
jgi:hypothetical protein